METVEEIIEAITTADQPDIVVDKIEWNETLGSNIEVQKALARVISAGDDSESYRILMSISNIESLVGCLLILEAVVNQARSIGGYSGRGYEPGDELRAEMRAKGLLRMWIKEISKFKSLSKDPELKKEVARIKRSLRN